MKRSAPGFVIIVSLTLFFLAGCQTLGIAPGKAQAPVITLERVEIASIQPYYTLPRIGFKDCNSPGTAGTYGYSSTLNLAYIFNIHNPNSFPVMLDDIQFTTAFEGFDVNTPMVYEDQWIPPGKTNQLRVVVTNEAFNTQISLTVGSLWAKRIKDMGTTQAAIVKKWWETIGDFSFPIEVKNGTATFVCPDGSTVMSYFTGIFPKK